MLKASEYIFVTAAVLLAAAAVASDRPALEDPVTRAREALARHDPEGAVRVLEPYLASRPADDDARVVLAWARYRQGRFEQAEAAFLEVLARKAGHADARTGLAYTWLQLGRAGDAASIFLELLGEHDDHGDALEGLRLAALRMPRDDPRLEAALGRLERWARQNPEEPKWKEAIFAVSTRLGGATERRFRPPVETPRPPQVPTARIRNGAFELRDPSGSWTPVFLRGVNLGVALPGRFPSQFPEDGAIYARWLEQIASLHANVVRVYTLLPPAFYQALRGHNLRHPDAPLYLLQGVWAELPPRHDFSDPDYEAAFTAEIRRVVDAVHGDLALAPRPGHASGLYTADVARWTVGWLVGREWEPFAVHAYNQSRPGPCTFQGAWLQARSERAMECWVARMTEEAVAYEVRRYGELRPASFANWPTLDPLEHPTEANRDEEDRWRRFYGVHAPGRLRELPWEDDRTSLDATRIEPTAANDAGFFASYHIYPNYPDFMNLEPALADGRDDEGSSRYAGYLRRLKAYHGDQAVLVAEFGISTSRGIAHLQPEGWHHGGLDERDQGRLVARMLRSIHRHGYAGGVVFEFLDEWFKGTWSVAPFEVPAQRRRLWLNAESPEQHYGLMAVRPASAAIVVDGRRDDWAEVARILEPAAPGGSRGWARLEGLRVAFDEAYVYLLLETGGAGAPDWSRLAYRIAVDTWDPQRGERRLPPPGPAVVPTGVECLIEIAGPGRSRVRVSEPYEPQRRRFGGALAPSEEGRGVFVPLMLETNRERFARDGRRFPAQVVERGRLRFGSLDPASPRFDTRTDVAVGRDEGVLELRIPWGLLNVSDPSSHQVLFRDPARGDETFESRSTEGFRFYVFAADPSRPGDAPVARLPEGTRAPATVRWPGWETPRYRLEWKHGIEAVARAMEELRAPSGTPGTGGRP